MDLISCRRAGNTFETRELIETFLELNSESPLNEDPLSLWFGTLRNPEVEDSSLGVLDGVLDDG